VYHWESVVTRKLLPGMSIPLDVNKFFIVEDTSRAGWNNSRFIRYNKQKKSAY
jgi:hypothetical protein